MEPKTLSLRERLILAPEARGLHKDTEWRDGCAFLETLGFQKIHSRLAHHSLSDAAPGEPARPKDEFALFWHPEGVLLCANSTTGGFRPHPFGRDLKFDERQYDPTIVRFNACALYAQAHCGKLHDGRSTDGNVYPEGDGSWRLAIHSDTINGSSSLSSLLMDCFQHGALIPVERWVESFFYATPGLYSDILPSAGFAQKIDEVKKNQTEEIRAEFDQFLLSLPAPIARVIDERKNVNRRENPTPEQLIRLHGQSANQALCENVSAAGLRFAPETDRALFLEWSKIISRAIPFDGESALRPSSLGVTFFHLVPYCHLGKDWLNLLARWIETIPEERLLPLLAQTDPRGVTAGMACFESLGRSGASAPSALCLFKALSLRAGARFPLQTPSLSALSLLLSKAHGPKNPRLNQFDSAEEARIPEQMIELAERSCAPWRSIHRVVDWSAYAETQERSPRRLAYSTPRPSLKNLFSLLPLPEPFDPAPHSRLLSAPEDIHAVFSQTPGAERFISLIAQMESEAIASGMSASLGKRKTPAL